VLEAAVIAGQAAKNLSKPVEDVVEEASKAIHSASVGETSNSLQPIAEFIGSAVDTIQKRRNGEVPLGLTSGLADLDQLLAGGWQAGQMVIVAGRPSMGKSLAALGFAKAAAKAGRPSVFYALEMQKQELSDRLLADEAQVNLNAIRSGEVTDVEMERIRHAEKELARIPLHVDDKVNTMPKIWAEARRFKQKHGDLGVVAVDYLQRLSSSAADEKRRDLEVGDNAKQLKDLAMALDTTSIAVAQLNRGVELRTDKRPGMSDLRDSGQLEQEGDIIIMLYRDEYYVKGSPRIGEADFLVVKNRNGELDTVVVAAQLHYQRFVDMWHETPYRGA
jgi:replicative DNA helicase